MSGIFKDSKTFVDMPMKYNASFILRNFNLLPPNATVERLKKFVEDHFKEAGSDVLKVVPVDWVEQPTILSSYHNNKFIRDETLRNWGKSIHIKWKDLARTFDTQSACSDCHSYIPVPHPFVVAGGRFREYYYWDTYWIIEGLLDSDMSITTKGIIENYLFIINQHGFMPNGGRIYYLNRSQPPLLVQMIYKYFLKTGDVDLVRYALPILEREYAFFMDKKSVSISKNGKFHTLNRYNVEVSVPRPEAFKEDIHTANDAIRSGFSSNRKDIYSDLASGAESGWDFSSRWLDDPFKLHTIKTRDIAPVDLNCIMFKNEVILSELFDIVGDHAKKMKFNLAAMRRKSAIKDIMWDEESFMWYDYDINKKAWNKNFYPSNLLPFWSKSSHLTNSESLRLIQKIEHLNNIGGIPSSTFDNDLQWDSYNAWPPIQALVIEGIENIETNQTKEIAQSLVQRWITSNWCAWNATSDLGGVMFEKYNAKKIGMPGDGGEYEVQEGFGWTNGVALKFLTEYGNVLTLNPCQH